MSISDLIRIQPEIQNQIFGVVTGIVTNNEDPDSLGRVKVKIPHISDEDESAWARVTSFMAGAERGAVFLPEVDDEVLLAFEHGDLSRPYVIGALWNGQDSPPQLNDDGENNIRVIKSRSGHVIRLNDKDGEESIEIVDASEANSIVIATADNKITITSDADIEVSCPNGTFSVDADEVKIESAGNTEMISGGDLTGEASGSMTLTGSTIDLN